MVVCLDGVGVDYLDSALAAGKMPETARFLKKGARGQAMGVMPSYTNPNNVSIITGVSPAIHGISGNHFLDTESQREVAMNAASHLRCPTLLDGFAGAGMAVGCITAKEKLRALLSTHREVFSFSGELPGEKGEALMGQPAPDIYSGLLSACVLAAGAEALARRKLEVLYLTLTDIVPHKNPPGSEAANRFLLGLDRQLGKLDKLGAALGVTADHGMNDKTLPDGAPRVLYLGTLLKKIAGPAMRVVLPITDPHVVHHGSLGSYATLYLPRERLEETGRTLMKTEGIEAVLTREEAARVYHLPADRIGDLVITAGKHTVLGKTPSEHDLTGVGKGLRSHGGAHERAVPFFFNFPLKRGYKEKLRQGPANYDIFDFVMNGRAGSIQVLETETELPIQYRRRIRA